MAPACEAMVDGFAMIDNASIAHASLNHVKQYKCIVDRLQCGEQGVMVAALIFINVLIQAATTIKDSNVDQDQASTTIKDSNVDQDQTTRLARLVALLDTCGIMRSLGLDTYS